MIAAASPDDYARTIAAAASDPNVDSIIVMHIPTMVSVPEAIGAGIARGAAAAPAEKPVIAVYISSLGAPASIHGGRARAAALLRVPRERRDRTRRRRASRALAPARARRGAGARPLRGGEHPGGGRPRARWQPPSRAGSPATTWRPCCRRRASSSRRANGSRPASPPLPRRSASAIRWWPSCCRPTSFTRVTSAA